MLERKIFETTCNGQKITAEFNPIVAQASGSVLVRMGDTIVLATAVMSGSPRDTVEYFPLTVDYEEDTTPREKFLVRDS